MDRRSSSNLGLQNISRRSFIRALELDVEGAPFGSDEAGETALIEEELLSVGIAWDDGLPPMRRSAMGGKSGRVSPLLPSTRPSSFISTEISEEQLGGKGKTSVQQDETWQGPGGTASPRLPRHLRVKVEGSPSLLHAEGQPSARLSSSGSKVSFSNADAGSPGASRTAGSASTSVPSVDLPPPLAGAAAFQRRSRRASILTGPSASGISFFPREVLASWNYNLTNLTVDEMVREARILHRRMYQYPGRSR